MWKWIAAIMVFMIVALMGTCYLGYRRLAKAGDVVTETVHGSPEHVFALLTDRDSIAAWLPVGNELTPNGHGPVAVGDTIRVLTPSAPGDSSKIPRQVWVVREIAPPLRLVVDGIEFNTAGVPRLAMARRDSLVAVGDSTTIVSSFRIFPTVVNGDTTGRVASATLRAADGLRLGAAKAQWRVQLRRISSHLGMP
jgi:uncharacterized protein YndB with AHSA1/START domain